MPIVTEKDRLTYNIWLLQTGQAKHAEDSYVDDQLWNEYSNREKPHFTHLVADAHNYVIEDSYATDNDDVELHAKNDKKLRARFKAWGIDELFDWKNVDK